MGENTEAEAARRQMAEMLACGDLRTCQDCGARVPYLFSSRNWAGYPARCGKLTVEPRICPDGYETDRGPYPAGTLEAMTAEQLMAEMDRAYGSQASCVDNYGSDDASWRAEQRCKHVEQEMASRGLTGVYWDRPEAGPLPTTSDPKPVFQTGERGQ